MCLRVTNSLLLILMADFRVCINDSRLQAETSMSACTEKTQKAATLCEHNQCLNREETRQILWRRKLTPGTYSKFHFFRQLFISSYQYLYSWTSLCITFMGNSLRKLLFFVCFLPAEKLQTALLYYKHGSNTNYQNLWKEAQQGDLRQMH